MATVQLGVAVVVTICLSTLALGAVADGTPHERVVGPSDPPADAQASSDVESVDWTLALEHPQQVATSQSGPTTATSTAQATNSTRETTIEIAVWANRVNNPPVRGSLTLRDADGQVVAQRDLFDSSVQTFTGLNESERYSATADIANWPERTYAFKAGTVEEHQFVIGYEFKAAGKNYRFHGVENRGANREADEIRGVRLSNGDHAYTRQPTSSGNKIGDPIEIIVPGWTEGETDTIYFREGEVNGNESTNYWGSTRNARADHTPDLPIHRPVEVGLGDYNPDPVGATTIDGMNVDIFEIDLSNDPDDDFASEYEEGLAYVNRDTGYVVRVETDLVVRTDGDYKPIFGSYTYDFTCQTCSDDINVLAPIKTGNGLPPGVDLRDTED